MAGQRPSPLRGVAVGQGCRRGLTRLPEPTWLKFTGTTALLLLPVRGVLRLLLQTAWRGNAFAIQGKLLKQNVPVSQQHIDDTLGFSVKRRVGETCHQAHPLAVRPGLQGH
jgi:hypothetical protein